MKYTIEKLDSDVYEITLNEESLQLGNNYLIEHLVSELSKLDYLQDLLDDLYSLDCPEHTTFVFVYRGLSAIHYDELTFDHLEDLKNE